MFKLNPLPLFRRKYKKLIRRNHSLEAQFDRVLEQLMLDPTDRSLKSHKVPHRGREAFSASVTGDLRIIWNYSDEEVDMLDVIDTGGHEGGRGVYR